MELGELKVFNMAMDIGDEVGKMLNKYIKSIGKKSG